MKDEESIEEQLHFLLARDTGLFETVETRWMKFIARQMEQDTEMFEDD